MKTWEKVRNFWLATAFVSSSLVLLKLAVTPAQKPLPPSYPFPASVPLSRWQFVQATPIGLQKLYTPSLATSIDDLTIAGQSYRYLRNGKPLEIEMRYFRDYSSVSDILKESTIRNDRINFTPARSSVGAHATYQRSNRLFITACIPTTRETTITTGEFRSAQNRPDALIARSLPWFLGQKRLRDLRCLWTRISTPIDPASPSTTQQELEQAWIEWVQWWNNNYPPES
ncbi:MAG: cyanoexosortase A system-associated protein [Plectolyngbya sp. WJT66-NPBG17]|jgi:cyanosortase A-associated protein|nr:cyanoexosortase A system-associated protein [Plectolyngbya sp. WJT66-NPBG17]MBW4526124.1 cyanoexosortase A system-associated protein [Phormidium tanganyikae FI6-MK23]